MTQKDPTTEAALEQLRQQLLARGMNDLPASVLAQLEDAVRRGQPVRLRTPVSSETTRIDARTVDAGDAPHGPVERSRTTRVSRVTMFDESGRRSEVVRYTDEGGVQREVHGVDGLPDDLRDLIDDLDGVGFAEQRTDDVARPVLGRGLTAAEVRERDHNVGGGVRTALLALIASLLVGVFGLLVWFLVL